MEEFFEPFWNLDQIKSWAETRSPELVRAAAIPKIGSPKTSIELAALCFRVASALRQAGRDVQAELWAASGWSPSLPAEWSEERRLADELGVPIHRVLRQRPVPFLELPSPQTVAVVELFGRATGAERASMIELFDEHRWRKARIARDPRLQQLSPELRDAVVAYASAAELRGSSQLIRGPFPTIEYLERLFRTGDLRATANPRGDPKAYELTRADWAGLEIAVSGDPPRRLSVRRIGSAEAADEEAFDNVSVNREDVLQRFPDTPPAASANLEAILREAIRQNPNLTQTEAQNLARQRGADAPRHTIRDTLRRLGVSHKPGPRGPRNKRADPTA